MGDLGVEVDGLAWLEMADLAAQGKLEISLHYQDELFAVVFIGHWFVGLPRLDGDHEGAQVLVLRTWGEGLVGVVPGPLDEGLCPLVPNSRLLLLAQEGTRIYFQGAGEPEQKAYWRSDFVIFDLADELWRLPGGLGLGLQGPVMDFPKLADFHAKAVPVRCHFVPT